MCDGFTTNTKDFLEAEKKKNLFEFTTLDSIFIAFLVLRTSEVTLLDISKQPKVFCFFYDVFFYKYKIEGLYFKPQPMTDQME